LLDLYEGKKKIENFYIISIRILIMDYSIPSKAEIRAALEHRFAKNKDGGYKDKWACSFYENMLHFIRSPNGAYIQGEDIHDIKRKNFMNEIKICFPHKFMNDNELKVFSKCLITSEEFPILVDKMHSLYVDGIAEFKSWNRICKNHYK